MNQWSSSLTPARHRFLEKKLFCCLICFCDLLCLNKKLSKRQDVQHLINKKAIQYHIHLFFEKKAVVRGHMVKLSEEKSIKHNLYNICQTLAPRTMGSERSLFDEDWCEVWSWTQETSSIHCFHSNSISVGLLKNRMCSCSLPCFVLKLIQFDAEHFVVPT